MDDTRDRKGQILHWDDLFARHAHRATETPVESIDRDLRSLGFDPAGLQERLSAIDAARAEHARGNNGAAPRQPAAWARYAGALTGWHLGSAVSGALGVMVAGVIGLMVMQGTIGGTPAPSLAMVDAQSGALLADHKYQDAEPLYRLALSLEEKASGPTHPRVALRLNNLAHVLQSTDRLDEAEPLMLRALQIDWQHFAADPTAVARDLNNLAQLLEESYRQEAAEESYRFALAIFEQFSGPDHPDVATVLSNLANVLQATNRTGEAETLVLRALEIDESHFGPDHETVVRKRANLMRLREARTSCAAKSRDHEVQSVVFRAEETAREGAAASPGQHLQLAKWQVKSKSTKCSA